MRFRPSRPPRRTAPVKRRVTADDLTTLADQLEAAALALRQRARGYDGHPDRLAAVLGILGRVSAAWNAFARCLGDGEV